MARARILHPELARHEKLADLSHSHRLLFALLPTIADRKGRIEDRPRRIKADLFPYDDFPVEQVDGMLRDLCDAGFITRYEVNGVCVIGMPGFARWQKPHPREKESELPAMPGEEGAEDKSKASPGRTLDTPRRPVYDPVSEGERTPPPGSRAWERLRRHQSMSPADATPSWQANGFGSEAEFKAWLDELEKMNDNAPRDEREWQRRFEDFRMAYAHRGVTP